MEKERFELLEDKVEQEENRKFEAEFEDKKQQLEFALAGNKSYIEGWIEGWLSNCELPVEIDIDFDYRDEEHKLMIDLDLPEIEDLPTLTTTQLASGRFKEKNKSQKQLKEEYSRCVLGLMVFLSSTLFNASPMVEKIAISGYTQRRNKEGDIHDVYILSVIFTRDKLSSIDYSSLNPMETILQFENRMNLTVSGQFKEIKPFE